MAEHVPDGTPPPDELWYLDATALAERIRRRELSAAELHGALEERAAALNPALGALVTPIPGAAERARAADEALARGEESGPLHGVPFTVKDSFDTAGVRTTRGSLVFAEHVPKRDAEVVRRLGRAGAIPVAKTNVPEFVLWWETDNRVFGRTANPWDVERTAGGSSGGEAAAIAAGLSPLGIGSDLGGSIRLPASYCGVAGLKPTHGRVPLTGHWPETLLRFMHAGFLARSVRDLALALSLAAGADGVDPYALPLPPPGPLLEQAPAGLRAGVLAPGSFGPVEEEVDAAVRRAAEALAGRGFAVEEVEVPALARNDWNLLTMVLYGGGGGPYLRRAVGGRDELLSEPLRRRLSAPPPELATYVAAEAEVEHLRADVAAALRDHDVLLCPVTPTAAHGHGAASLAIGGEEHVPRSSMRATIPFDLTGSPALSVPYALSRAGLPLGVQVVGRPFEDPLVLAVGAALEEARGPLPHPPLGGT